MAGNAPFLAGTSKHGSQVSRRDALAAGQNPYAMVLSCADSRVPPEIIFDQSLGELFVVRLAGNFAEEHGIGSFQYAVAQSKRTFFWDIRVAEPFTPRSIICWSEIRPFQATSQRL